jgi:hypothetical protein
MGYHFLAAAVHVLGADPTYHRDRTPLFMFRDIIHEPPPIV